METIGIHCNSCWKEIIEKDRCIITSCFHLFCDYCASNKLSTMDDRICPICDNSLVSKGSLFGTTIDSSFDKTIQLFGISPKKILMMAEKAIEFYNYQSNIYLQSYMFQAQQSMNQFDQLKRSNDELLFKIESLEKQLKLQRVDGENDKKEIVELTEKLAEKTRQKRKLEELYLSLKENMLNNNNGVNNNKDFISDVINNNNNNNNVGSKLTNGNSGNNVNNNNNNSNGQFKTTNGFKLSNNTNFSLSKNSPSPIRSLNVLNNNGNNNNNSGFIGSTLKPSYRSPSFCSSPINIKPNNNNNNETNMIPPNNNTTTSKYTLSTPKKPSLSSLDKFSFIQKSTPSQKK